MIDAETCHCGSPMRGSDHCPECGCEEYERDCGRRPVDAKRVVMIGMIGPMAGSGRSFGMILRGPNGFQR